MAPYRSPLHVTELEAAEQRIRKLERENEELVAALKAAAQAVHHDSLDRVRYPSTKHRGSFRDCPAGMCKHRNTLIAAAEKRREEEEAERLSDETNPSESDESAESGASVLLLDGVRRALSVLDNLTEGDKALSRALARCSARQMMPELELIDEEEVEETA